MVAKKWLKQPRGSIGELLIKKRISWDTILPDPSRSAKRLRPNVARHEPLCSDNIVLSIRFFPWASLTPDLRTGHLMNGFCNIAVAANDARRQPESDSANQDAEIAFSKYSRSREFQFKNKSMQLCRSRF
ncbi:hypothetical protein [Ruegeria sp. A3M17]|uniref:hypothetical protein n=1 Tax=Ruegeria sp. A3M17 TaxID=2267229 RepID=UPI0011BEB61D|nr:hypothetical protein [Ruegeria sp. A3M17]